MVENIELYTLGLEFFVSTLRREGLPENLAENVVVNKDKPDYIEISLDNFLFCGFDFRRSNKSIINFVNGLSEIENEGTIFGLPVKSGRHLTYENENNLELLKFGCYIVELDN